MRIQNINGVWVDSKNNKWNLNYSEACADAYSKSLIDCFNCTDCVDCIACKDCIDCTDCVQCIACIDCVRCSDCELCTKCISCTSCNVCIDSKILSDAFNYINNKKNDSGNLLKINSIENKCLEINFTENSYISINESIKFIVKGFEHICLNADGTIIIRGEKVEENNQEIYTHLKEFILNSLK